LHLSTKQNLNINKLLKILSDNCPTRFQTVGAWVMIGGMPNIGKSTIINSLRKKDHDIASKSSNKSGAKTGS
jgi:ribosome biogenesis GTPase A